MECNNYRLETEFLNDGSSVAHTTRVDANLPPITTVWTTTRLIGHGGDGVVDLQSEQSGLVRAVKRVHVCDRYMKEVIILSKVSDRHDLFVQFLGWYEDKNFLYIAMEFIANGDLAEYIKARGESPVPEQTCQAISRQLLEGLQVLHERLICHRDLKPRNILVATLEPISVKITDFGVSKHLEGTVYRTRVGTVGYIAPEIQGMWPPPRTRRVPFGMAVDIWAAGCIIYQLLSLQLPFAREWEDGQDITLTDGYSVGDCSQMVVEMDMPRLLAYCMGQEPLPIEALQRSGNSLNAMEVVRALLRADPAARVTATEALEYPWLLRPEQHFRFRVEPTITGPSTSGSRRTPPPRQPADPGAPREEPNSLTDYPHTAKALYSFDSGRYSSKQNILSFSMFDIMDVLDVSKTSAWWSARDKSGERGWVPSNYFVVINSLLAEDPSINTHTAPGPATDLRETVIETSTTSNLSVLSLIVTILQGYREIKTFVPDNKMHDHDARLLYSTAIGCRVLLGSALENFLQDIIEDHTRHTMLDDLGSPHWHEDELNTRVNNTLGRFIHAVKSATLSCTQTLGQIQHLQASLFQRPTHEGNPEKVAENVLSDLVKFRERRKELERYSVYVFQLLNSVKVKAGSPPATEFLKQWRGTRPIIAAMKHLQVAISDALICQCHTVYLCLGGQVATEASNNNRNGVSSEMQTPMDVKPQFLFLFTKGKNTTMIPESLLVSFRSVIVPSQTPDRWRGNICANVEGQRVGYERYFRIPHYVSGGFRLRLERSLPYALDDGGGMFSFNHLITTRPHQLTTIDRLLIGIGLAESFLHLYGSPWLRHWGVDTIYYLTEQAKEEPTARLWTPHLVLSPGAGATYAVSDRNQDMFRLGYMLLQVGLGGRGLGSGTVVLTSGVPTLVRLDESMGSAYANLATWCLMQGHRSMSDLMPNLAIEMFMIHLDRLRRAADTADT